MNPTCRPLASRLVHHMIRAALATWACAAAACLELGDHPQPEVSRTQSAIGLGPNGEGAGHPFTSGGIVQPRPKVFLLFWGPRWQTDTVHLQVFSKVLETFAALPGSAYNNILTTYGVENAVQLMGSAVDSSTPPALVGLGIDELPEKREAFDAAMRAFASHSDWHSDLNTQVIVFPQQGTSYVDLDPFPGLGFCGAHSWAKFHNFAYALVKWAADFDCHNTDSVAEDIAWTAVHEYVEMATDPNIHLSLNPLQPPVVADGWHTDESSLTPHEVSDVCEGWTVRNTAGNDDTRAPRYRPVYPPGQPTFSLPMQWSTDDSACISSKGREFVSPDAIAPFNHKHTVQGAILTKYLAMGADVGLLGPPMDEEIRFSTGAVSYFGGQVCNGGFTTKGRTTGSAIYFQRSTGAANEVHGCIYQKYNALGGHLGLLGLPVTDETDVPSAPFGRVSYFAGAKCPTASGPFNSGSAVYFSPWLGAHAVQGCIYPHYVYAQGGPAGHLGFPTSDQQMIADGRVSYFDGHGCARRGPENSGSAIYSSVAGTHSVWGCIYEKYIYDTHPTGGGPTGHHGFPTTDEIAIPGGAVSYFYGNNCGPDRGPHNEGSAIFAGPGGVHSVQGCIYRRYRLPEKPFNGAPDEPGGPESHLGWPSSDEIVIPGKGWVSYFLGNGCTSGERGLNNSGSAIYADGIGIHAVQGCIYTKYWRDHGGPEGILGFPTSNELQINGGWASYFRAPTNFCGPETGPGGAGAGIFASGPTGVHTVMGCIFTGYMRFGGPGAHLGFPVSEEIQIPNGWVSYFAGNACPGYIGPSGSGSAIYAGPGGTHFVQGCIYKKYIELGGPGGRLGFPTSDETPNSTGWISHFEHGYIRATGSSIIVFIG